MQGVNVNLAERVFDIDTAQHDAGKRAMAGVQDPSTNILEDVTKLTRRGNGEISIVIHTRTVPISYKRQVFDGTQLPTSTALRGETRKPRISEADGRFSAKHAR